MKNFLLIAYAYPPISSPGAVRAVKMVKHLQQYGWQAHVVTAKQGYSQRIGGLEDPYENTPENITRFADPIARANTHLSASNEVKKSKVSQLKGMLKSKGKQFLRPDRSILWARTAVRHKADFEKDYEFVYSTSPAASNHIVAYKTAKSLGIPWIAEFRDPLSWVDEKADISTHRRKSMARFEAWVAKHADALVVVSDTFKDYFEQRYPNANIVSIPNGAEFREADILKTINERAERTKPAGEPFRLIHTGSLYGGARPPHAILRACQKAMDETDLKFECIFAGNDSYLATEAAKEIGIDVEGPGSFVKDVGVLPRNETFSLIESADVAISLLHREELGKLSIMSKFLDYIPTGIPILNLGNDEYILSKIIKEQNAGASFDYDDVEGLTDWLKNIPDLKAPDTLGLCKNWSVDKMAEKMNLLFISTIKQ